MGVSIADEASAAAAAASAKLAASSAVKICRVRLLRNVLYCRLLAIALTLIAALEMSLSKAHMKRFPKHAPFLVKASDFRPFIYFIVANVLVLVHSVITAGLTYREKLGSQTQLPLTVLDLLAVIILFVVNAAAAMTEDLAWNGNLHIGWKQFCSLAESFCGIITAANIISSLAAVIYFLVIVFSIIIIHRGSQY